MKVFAVAALALALPLALFAQAPARESLWKPGTVVTREYKELKGTVSLDQMTVPVLKADGIDYLLLLSPRDPAALALKNGASVSVKGVATKVVVAGKPDQLTFRPFEVTVGDQTYQVRKAALNGKRGWGNFGMTDRKGMMGRKGMGNGWGNQGAAPPPPPKS